MKAIFYASSTGNTEEVANKINERLEDFELIDISRDGIIFAYLKIKRNRLKFDK